MSSSPYFLAIDLSASSVDLALITSTSEVEDMVSRHVQRQEDGAQDPQDWWRAVRTGIKDLLRRSSVRKDDIRSIAVTGDDLGLVCVNRAGEALGGAHLSTHPAIDGYAEWLDGQLGARNLANLVGGPSFPGCAASLAGYIQDHHPRRWHDSAAAMSPRDFLSFRLTEQRFTDPSTAAATRFLNPRTGAWSKMVVDRLKIPTVALPEIHPGHRLGGRVSPNAAKETGLSPGTPVAIGANRTACLALTAGAIAPGQAVLQLADQGHLSAYQQEWRKPHGGQMEIGCHTVPRCWGLIVRDVGNARDLQWFTDELAATDVQQWRRAGRDSMDVIAEIAAEAPPGSADLHYVGHDISGGGLIGLTSHHQRSHVLRAYLEHVGYRVRNALDHLRQAQAELDSLTIIGRGAHCHLWCQIISDVCDREVQAIEHQHPTLLGCGMLAAMAIGTHKTYASAVKKLPVTSKTYAPRKSAAQTYNVEFLRHQRLIDSLPGLFARTDAPED